MRKLSNTEAELKKKVAYKKKRVFDFSENNIQLESNQYVER